MEDTPEKLGACSGRTAGGPASAFCSSSPANRRALRWLRRRLDLVYDVLTRVIGLIPDKLAGCAATMGAVRERLDSDSALMALRGLVAGQLRTLPAPLGFQPHGIGVRSRKSAFQQRAGPDPPPLGA